MASTESGPATRHIDALDGARGIAAASIAVCHFLEEACRAGHGVAVSYAASFIGSAAVGLFFLVSGFVVPGSIGHTGLAGFAVRRVLRLYPVIVACALLKFAVLLRGGYLPATGASVTLLLQSMTLFSNTVLWNDRNIEPIFWTLMIEAKFYIFVAAAYCLAWRSPARSSSILVATLFAMAVLGRVLPDPTRPWISDIDVTLSTMPMLLAGWFLWLHRQGTIRMPELTAGLVGCVAVLAMAPYPIYVSLDKGAPSWALAFAAFVAMLHAPDPAGILAGPAARFLGRISFPLYAVHPAVILVLERHGSGHPVLDLALYAGLVLAIAWMIHVSIEAPAMRLSRRLARRRPVTLGPDTHPEPVIAEAPGSAP